MFCLHAALLWQRGSRTRFANMSPLFALLLLLWAVLSPAHTAAFVYSTAAGASGRGVARAHNVRSQGSTASKLSLAASGGTTDGDELAEAKIIVKGQAYGGYFRAHARNEAHFNRKLCGALQEFPDRTEIVVEGKRKAIDSFVRWCRKGPGLAQRIEDVQVNFSDYTGIFDRQVKELVCQTHFILPIQLCNFYPNPSCTSQLYDHGGREELSSISRRRNDTYAVPLLAAGLHQYSRESSY
jgi:acylphosphatase